MEGLFQQDTIQGAEPGRTVLQSRQTLPEDRNAIRKARRKLPRHAQAGIHPDLVAQLMSP